MLNKFYALFLLGLISVSLQAYEVTLPYSQNFETFTRDTYNPVPLSDYWQNVSGDSTPSEWDWYVHAGTTPSSNTGPAGDHTTGSGQYLYIEDSNPNNNANIILLSPSFNVVGTTMPVASIWSHSNNGGNSSSQNTLHIDIVADTDGTLLATDVITLQHVDNNWHQQTIDLAAYTGSGDIRLRFRADANNGTYTHDIAIDDFKVRDIAVPDVGVVSIDAPVTGHVLTTTEVVVITIKNFGALAQSQIPVSYTLNSGTPVTETLPGPVAPQATVSYTFKATADLGIPGTYMLTATTTFVGDADNSNDQTLATIESVPIISTFPYDENFEAGVSGWVAGGINSSWQLGTPAKEFINGASAGHNAWVTHLTDYYPNNEQSFVLSPIFDLSGLSYPEILLDVWWESDDCCDGAALQYSTDGGTSWTTVGQTGDPNNWYTSDEIRGLGFTGNQAGWTGSYEGASGSDGWLTARHELTGLGGESLVRLRIVFGSDDSATGDGFAFDQIIVRESPATDMGVIAIDKPSISGLKTATTVVEITVKNFGSATQSNIPVSYL